MQEPITQRDEAPIERVDSMHRRICSSERELFSAIAEVDRLELWRDSGARDMAHWLWRRQGISEWKARRWIASAHALDWLPEISKAFSSGELSVDKVVELTRFATPQTQSRLIGWAKGVSSGAIRRRAELLARRFDHDLLEPEQSRHLSWWYTDEGRRFALEAELPAAEGAVVEKTLRALAEKVPVLPGEEDPYWRDARRADALVALCSSQIAEDSSPGRPTVIVHAPVEALLAGDRASEIEAGPVIHPRVTERLLCNARVQTVVEDARGDLVGLGRMRREPSAPMMRQLRFRDYECRFPGCGARRFTQAHHIVWWNNGGRTELQNLVLVCFFHHKLVHEHGWSLKRDPDGAVRWFRPDGTGYRAGPGPPPESTDREPALSA